jgi:hypothetical protein
MNLELIEMSAMERAYVLIALRTYEKELLESDADLMEDAAHDLIFVQALINRFKELTVQP